MARGCLLSQPQLITTSRDSVTESFPEASRPVFHERRIFRISGNGFPLKKLVAPIGTKLSCDHSHGTVLSPFYMAMCCRAHSIFHVIRNSIASANIRPNQLAARPIQPRNIRMANIGGKAAPLQLLPRRQAAQLHQCRIYIQRLHERVRADTTRTRIRRRNDKRPPRVGLIACRLAPYSVLAETITVVAPENDTRVFGQTAAVQRVNDNPHLRIRDARSRAVSVAQPGFPL